MLFTDVGNKGESWALVGSEAFSLGRVESEMLTMPRR